MQVSAWLTLLSLPGSGGGGALSRHLEGVERAARAHTSRGDASLPLAIIACERAPGSTWPGRGGRRRVLEQRGRGKRMMLHFILTGLKLQVIYKRRSLSRQPLYRPT